MVLGIKKIALSVLGLLLLSAAGIALFLVVAGEDFFRWTADRLLEKAVGREVEIDGRFSLDLSSEPTLVVTDLWIANASWAEKPEMVRVKRIEVQVALRPLLSRVVYLPRLAVEGVTVDLETGPDGVGNWEVARTSGEHHDGGVSKDLFYPLIERISLKDVSIVHSNRQSGRDTKLVVQSLHKDRPIRDTMFVVQGQGRLNQSDFRINGRFGSLEDALAATTPYPLELTLNGAELVAELKGTVDNLPHAKGFELSLTARAPSIGRVLETWASNLVLEGRAEASARLHGDLESLSVQDLLFKAQGQSGQELQVKGSLANLLRGQGLDLQFSGKLSPAVLGPMHRLPRKLQGLVDGFARLDMVGRMTGNVKTAALERLHARLEHRSGATFSLQGQMSLDLSGGGPVLKGLEATSILSLPTPALLEQALGTELPDLGAIHTRSALALKQDWITLDLFTAEAESFGGLRLRAEGRLGRLAKGKLDLQPRLDVSASSEDSRPLISLFAGLLGQATPRSTIKDADSDHKGPTDAALVLSIQRRLSALGLHPGTADGIMGPHTRAAIEAYQTQNDLTVDGRATENLLSHLQADSRIERPRATPEPHPVPARAASLEQALPELGPIEASGRLSGGNGAYRLDDLHLTIGATTGTGALVQPAQSPAARLTGQIGDLMALKQVALSASFEVPITSLLGPNTPAQEASLGAIRGQFSLSDADGSLGIEKFQAEAVNTDLLSLSVRGALDELAHPEQGRFQTSLEIPDPSRLGRQVGLDVGRLRPLSYTGHLSGSDQGFFNDGKAQVGQTELSGTLFVSIKDTRPVIRAKLSSPVFYLADFGLLPEADTEKVAQEIEGLEQGLFSDDPIPFEVLRDFDLDLDLRLHQLRGLALDIDTATAQLNLEDGSLKIEPFRFIYGGGSVVGHSIADTRGKDPKISLRLEGDDVDVGDLLAQVEVDVPLDGELDLFLDLRASGASPRALTASLKGDWDMAISRGQVRTSLLDLAAMDLIHWMTSDAKRKGYSDLNCFILRLDFHQGVGQIARQLLDTPNVLAVGTGDINLRDETIHIKVEPHDKKARMALATPFSIEGPLASPSVTADGVLIRIVSEIVLAAPHLLGATLLDLVRDQGKDPDNPCLMLEAGIPEQ